MTSQLLWYIHFHRLATRDGKRRETPKSKLITLLVEKVALEDFKTDRKSEKKIKDNHKEKAPSNKTPALRKGTNMGVWALGTLNPLFIRGFYTETKLSKL